MNLIENFNNWYTKNYLTEGTHYDTVAANILVRGGLCSNIEQAKEVIDGVQNKIHSFAHAPNWLMKYLKGIARMMVEENTVELNFNIIQKYINYAINYHKSNSQADMTALDNNFITKMTYKELEDKVEEYEKNISSREEEQLSKMNFQNKSSYDLIPIYSYEQLHKMFGGNKTGDGKSGEWCHTNNGEDFYEGWTNGVRMFFILAKKGWENIKFNEDTNEQQKGKDEYGNSLIALLVTMNGKLKHATLRCNHEGIEGDADLQYDNYADLSSIAGFNVKEAIINILKKENLYKETPTKITIPTNIAEINYNTFKNIIKDSIKEVIIPNNITKLGFGAFAEFESLISVTIPDSVTTIGEGAFCGCRSLLSIKIPNSVTSIGEEAFGGCKSLQSIKIPNSVISIGEAAFSYCDSLQSIIIPDSVTYIKGSAFRSCLKLKSINIPYSVTSIDKYVFFECSSLQNIKIPESITSIGEAAFCHCIGLQSMTIPDSVKSIGDYAFVGCKNLKNINAPDNIKQIILKQI